MAKVSCYAATVDYLPHAEWSRTGGVVVPKVVAVGAAAGPVCWMRRKRARAGDARVFVLGQVYEAFAVLGLE